MRVRSILKLEASSMNSWFIIDLIDYKSLTYSIGPTWTDDAFLLFTLRANSIPCKCDLTCI